MSCTPFYRIIYNSSFTYISQNPDRFQNILMSLVIINAILILTATLGNGLVILSIFRSPNLHTPSYILISGLALSDLFVGLVLHPILITLTFSVLKENYEVFCYSSRSLDIVVQYLGAVSFLMSLLISIDRYLALTLKHRYRAIVSKKRTLLSVLLAWSSLLFLTMLSQGILELRQYLLEISGAVGLAALITTCIVYFVSFMRLYRHSSQVGLSENQGSFDANKYQKSFKTMLILLVCLLLCYVPLISVPFLRLLHVKGDFTFDTVFYVYTTIFFGLNSTINPVVYLIRFTDIRHSCKQVLKFKA